MWPRPRSTTTTLRRPSSGEQDPHPARWPWMVGVAAILAAVALVASVSLLVFPQSHQPPGRPHQHDRQTAAVAGRACHHAIATAADVRGSAVPAADRDGHGHVVSASAAHQRGAPACAGARTQLGARPDERSAPAADLDHTGGPRQVTYSVTGTNAPLDVISITFTDAAGRSRMQRNVYIPWTFTVTPISNSDVGSV